MSAPPSDPNTLSAMRERYGERYRWLLLLSVMVGTMASIMSSTIINVAIPDMSQHFVLGQERAQWASSGFMAAMTVSMLTTPWLLARYGYRRTYAGCMWLLLAGGVGGGLADSFGLVLAARVAEGLAAGVVQPIPAIIILRAFEPHEQGRASGIFGMGVVLAPALGPSIGGLLVDGFGWRSIFFMVVPFCLASLWLARRFVPTTSPGGGAANPQGAALDWRGLLLAAAGTLCLLNGLVELHRRHGAERCGVAGRRGAAAGGVCGAAAAHAEKPPPPPRPGRGPAHEPLAVRRPALRHGQHRGLHLRHRAVRLHLPAAGLHADGPGLVGVLCGHHPAAGGPGAGGHHRRGRAAWPTGSPRTGW